MRFLTIANTFFVSAEMPITTLNAKRLDEAIVIILTILIITLSETGCWASENYFRRIFLGLLGVGCREGLG